VSETTFELSRSEPDTRGVCRIVRQRIAKAGDTLRAARLTDEKVHTARKELKKARAILRLLRDSLSDGTYERENSILRDAARPLSEVRDGKVLLTTLDELVASYGAPARALPVNGLKRTLRRDRSDARRRVLNGAEGLKPQRAALQKASKRAARWPCSRHGWKVIGAGLGRTYRKGRKALDTAQSDSSVENLHEWRKQVKYLWLQLRILQPLWPGLIGELADQTHKLADYLGDNHDLAVLRTRATENEDAVSNAAGRSALLALIDRRRAELRDKAFILGRRIYEETPKEFAARFRQYWRDWKSQPKTGA
jgi:CHAD domain-containing protein